jgi:hypothetical protein
MGRIAWLPAWLEHLAGISKEPHLHEGPENVSRVIAPAPASSGLSQPPLNMRQRERGSLYVAPSPASSVGGVTLKHGHGVTLDLAPVGAMREEADPL